VAVRPSGFDPRPRHQATEQMTVFGDFTTGFSIGRHIARTRAGASQGHAQRAQRELRADIIQQLYPGPVTGTVQWGIRVGENVFLMIVSVAAIAIVVSALLVFR
jgi:hypothetical protein